MMLKKQRPGRDVKEAEWKGRLRKEEHGKRSKEDDKELRGAEEQIKCERQGRGAQKREMYQEKGIRMRRVEAETQACFTSRAPNSSHIGFSGENS